MKFIEISMNSWKCSAVCAKHILSLTFCEKNLNNLWGPSLPLLAFMKEKKVLLSIIEDQQLQTGTNLDILTYLVSKGSGMSKKMENLILNR